MYRYFVSYHYTDKKNFGFGSCECETKKKIEDYEHINNIREIIKKQTRSDEIIILNYKLLREEK